MQISKECCEKTAPVKAETRDDIARLTAERDAARQALAEVLPFVGDARSIEAGTAEWHRRNSLAIQLAAAQFGRLHMLST